MEKGLFESGRGWITHIFPNGRKAILFCNKTESLVERTHFKVGFQCLTRGWRPTCCLHCSQCSFLSKDTEVLGWVSSGFGAKTVCSAVRPLGCSVRTNWPPALSARFVLNRGRPCWTYFGYRYNSSTGSCIDFPSVNCISNLS